MRTRTMKPLFLIFCLCLSPLLMGQNQNKIQEAMAMNQFNTVPEGISIVEECRLYIHSGIRSVLLDKGRFLIGLIIFTSVSLFIIIVDLYNDGDRDERMRRKRLQKRK